MKLDDLLIRLKHYPPDSVIFCDDEPVIDFRYHPQVHHHDWRVEEMLGPSIEFFTTLKQG